MIVIPMAGKSSRFYKAGYDLPKFKLPIGDKTNVFREVLGGFSKYFKKERFLFINRSDDNSFEFITQECEFLGIAKIDIITVDQDTRGQADTVFLGLRELPQEYKDEEIYIFNIDSIRVGFAMPTDDFLNNTSGFLEVFYGEGDHWSFVDAGKHNLVNKTTEKIKISDLCSNGLYYFSSIQLFLDTFNELETINEYKEFFIAPMYNILINNKKIVKYRLLKKEQTIFSGTPAEYISLLNSNYLKERND